MTLVSLISSNPKKNLFLSLSLNSKASLDPVEAPEGAHAEPVDPSSKVTVALTVGLPLESKISNALIFAIFVIF